MRIRSIKPEFWESESLGRVSRNARLLFIGLWMIADDSGRARGGLDESSRFLARVLFPYDDDAKDQISCWLDELIKEGCVINYEVDGSHYLFIPKFLSHQRIDRPSKSKYPPFIDTSTNTQRTLASVPYTSPPTPIPSYPEGGCKGETELPTLEQAITMVMTCGIPDKYVKHVHDDWTTREGCDAAGARVSFVRYAKKRWEREKVKWNNGTHQGNKPDSAKKIIYNAI